MASGSAHLELNDAGPGGVLVYLRDADAWTGKVPDFAFYDPEFADATKIYLKQDPAQSERLKSVYLVSALQLRTLVAAWPGDTAARLFKKLMTMNDHETVLVVCDNHHHRSVVAS